MSVLNFFIKKLGGYGFAIFLILLIFGTRTFWDHERRIIPHVMEFNMYLYSFSANDGTEFPDVSLSIDGEAISLDKEKLKTTSMGYIHLSDRWDFFPPLYSSYFCDPKVSEKLGYKIVPKFKIEISYIKNYSENVSYVQEIRCN